jgi:RHS repeat-associated protein
MLMPGRKYSSTSSYRYGFNGKENDNEVKGEGNQQDYGMRIYDPRLVRFLSVDPITEEYPELTPYQFASNRPIDGIDLDGLEWVEAEIGIVDGKPKLTIISWDKTSPIGITYSDFTVNIKYSANGQHYRFTTAPLSGFASIFSSASGRENEFFPKFDEFVKDPVTTINNGNVTSVEQEFMSMVADYGALEMMSPSPARVSGSIESKGGATTKSSPATATNKQATAANKGNTNAASSNTATPQATPSKVSKSVKTESIGGGKYTKRTEVKPSKIQPGQSRAEFVRYKNKDGKTIRSYKDAYDRANKFQHRKPTTGNPEGTRPASKKKG